MRPQVTSYKEEEITYPSPNPTLTLTFYSSKNVCLGRDRSYVSWNLILILKTTPTSAKYSEFLAFFTGVAFLLLTLASETDFNPLGLDR